jgi:hypothetical protein
MNPIAAERLPLFEALPPPWRQYGPPFSHPPLARVSDPETSHRAAERAASEQDRQEGQIHAYLLGVGPAGKTSKEIGAALDWGPKGDVIVARRMAGMREAARVSTYDWTPGKDHPDGPGHLLQDAEHAPRDGSCVHVAREHAPRGQTP